MYWFAPVGVVVTQAVLVAGVFMYLTFVAGMALLGGLSRPIPEPPPAGELRKVKIIYRCSICGTEVRMTAANEQEPEPPRHCLEEAEIGASIGTEPPAYERGGPDTFDFSLMTALGVSAVGSTFLEARPDPADWTERLLQRASTFVPGIFEAPIRGVRACARPVAADGRPLIGEVSGVDGLFVCAGHGPWGISTGPASARLIVDRMLGRSIDIPAVFDPARFGPIPA